MHIWNPLLRKGSKIILIVAAFEAVSALYFDLSPESLPLRTFHQQQHKPGEKKYNVTCALYGDFWIFLRKPFVFQERTYVVYVLLIYDQITL
jgi:hypothetical protein